ncbi:MAG: hypothetical protein ACRYG2_37265 [Janthinobacterium lividum]
MLACRPCRWSSYARPRPRLAEGELTHLDRVPVDVALARTRWEGYVAAGVAPEVAAIRPPGHLDGGDVLEVGDVIYVGRGARTDDEGGASAGYEPLVDDPAAYPTFPPVPEEHGTAVVDLVDADAG